MCIIIDANVTHVFIKEAPEAEPVLKWIISGKGYVAIGGKNSRELKSSNAFAALLRQFILAARVKQYDDAAIGTAEKALQSAPLKSDDPHILALAQVSGCRLLFSRDKPLHEDFTSAKLLATPRGKVYQRAVHVRLLSTCPPCK